MKTQTKFVVVTKNEKEEAVYIRFSALGRRVTSDVVTPQFVMEKAQADAIVRDEQNAFVLPHMR